MLTSRLPLAFATMSVSALLGLAVGCKPGECLRVSDCNTGLMCVDGTCIDAGTDAHVDAGGDARPDGAPDARVDSRADSSASDAGKRPDSAQEGGSARDGGVHDGPTADAADAHADAHADAGEGGTKQPSDGGAADGTRG